MSIHARRVAASPFSFRVSVRGGISSFGANGNSQAVWGQTRRLGPLGIVGNDRRKDLGPVQDDLGRCV